MIRHERRLRTNSSGQLLIVAALAIAILISSTTMYVYELGRESNSSDSSSLDNFVFALKQSTKNTVISSLANISNGGEAAILLTNLNELSQILGNLTQLGICRLDFTVFNDSYYDSGIWLSWNTSGIGLSSVYTDFTLRIYGITANVTVNYAVNVTTALTVNGYFIKLAGNEKIVNLTCKLYNEEKPTLAKSMNAFYEKLGSWIPADNPSIIDYGNGTYTISFIADSSSNDLQVSVNAHDSRDILVQANTTCLEI